MNLQLRNANIQNCLRHLEDYFTAFPDENGKISPDIQARIQARESLAHLTQLLDNKTLTATEPIEVCLYMLPSIATR